MTFVYQTRFATAQNVTCNVSIVQTVTGGSKRCDGFAAQLKRIL